MCIPSFCVRAIITYQPSFFHSSLFEITTFLTKFWFERNRFVREILQDFLGMNHHLCITTCIFSLNFRSKLFNAFPMRAACSEFRSIFHNHAIPNLIIHTLNFCQVFFRALHFIRCYHDYFLSVELLYYL